MPNDEIAHFDYCADALIVSDVRDLHQTQAEMEKLTLPVVLWVQTGFRDQGRSCTLTTGLGLSSPSN